MTRNMTTRAAAKLATRDETCLLPRWFWCRDHGGAIGGRDNGGTGVGLRAGATDGCAGGYGVFAISSATADSNRAISASCDHCTALDKRRELMNAWGNLVVLVLALVVMVADADC